MNKELRIKNNGKKLHTSASGISLLEVILSVAIMAVLAGMSVPVYQGFQTKNDLEVGVNTTVQSLKRAQVLSQAVEGDSSWGVKVQTDSIVLFRGTSFALRNTSFDETFDLPSNIIPSGVTEIVYSKLTGLPQITGTTVLTTVASDTRTITTNSKGMVEY